MIKVEKDLTDVPDSLNSTKTNQRRDEIIKAGEYPTAKTLKSNSAFEAKTLSPYDNRYKRDDIKEKLEGIYNYKCVYCEQYYEGYHIEHYRPKSIYYWLAYSWDNLLFCCFYCNIHKDIHFKIVKKISINDHPVNDIHNLRDIYDKLEQPQLVNPEKEDIYDYLVYKKNGHIRSNNDRVQYTITICKIDRTYLNKRRENLYLNDFEQKIISRIREYNRGEKSAKIKLRGFIEDFIKDSENPVKEFISFRKYIIKHWLKELIAEHAS